MVDLFGGLDAGERERPTEPSRRSKYTPLSIHLGEQSDGQCALSFEEIEEIIRAKLPKSAKDRRTGSLWWGNDMSRTQAKHGWLRAGWQTVNVNYAEECVLFVRGEK